MKVVSALLGLGLVGAVLSCCEEGGKGSAELCAALAELPQGEAEALSEQLDEDCNLPDEEAGIVSKRKPNFIRFGKRKPNFIRFGKRKPNFIRFGKRSEGLEKRKPNFIRFG